MPGGQFLVDTNILLRLVQPDSADHEKVRRCVDLLWEQGADLFYTSQNLAEFWNVCTRPSEKNGFGFSIEETDERTAWIEDKLKLAPESEATHKEWRRLVVAHRVCGVQVHDARLIASMHVHGIGKLLTLNVRDFRRYDGIIVVSPCDVPLVV